MGARAESRVGFGLRLVAGLIDAVFMVIGGIVIGSVFGGILGGVFGSAIGPIELDSNTVSGAQAGGMIGMLLGMLIALPIFGALYALLEAFAGATIGKMLLGIKIGDDDGTKAGFAKLLLRYALKNGAFLLSLLAGLVGVKMFGTLGSIWGFVWFLGCFLALTQARQGLHDKIAGTAVYPRKVLR